MSSVSKYIYKEAFNISQFVNISLEAYITVKISFFFILKMRNLLG